MEKDFKRLLTILGTIICLSACQQQAISSSMTSKASESSSQSSVSSKEDNTEYCLISFIGARGRNRTGTVSLPLDFESSASTSFTTRAAC